MQNNNLGTDLNAVQRFLRNFDDCILRETNSLELEYINDNTRLKFVPNFSTIGKTFGSDTRTVIQHINADANAYAVAASLIESGVYKFNAAGDMGAVSKNNNLGTDTDLNAVQRFLKNNNLKTDLNAVQRFFELTLDHGKIEKAYPSIPNYVSYTNEDITIYINNSIDENVLQLFNARIFATTIQKYRKTLCLKPTDNIWIEYCPKNEFTEKIVNSNIDYIQKIIGKTIKQSTMTGDDGGEDFEQGDLHFSILIGETDSHVVT